METTVEQLQKTIEKLQAALDREIAYTRKINDRNMRLQEQLKNTVSKAEYEKVIADYERKLSKINLQQQRIHNERGAGRKRVASKEITTRVWELREKGLSQAKIAAVLSDELNIKIGRTTVGEIVRGNYTLPDSD